MAPGRAKSGPPALILGFWGVMFMLVPVPHPWYFRQIAQAEEEETEGLPKAT